MEGFDADLIFALIFGLLILGLPGLLFTLFSLLAVLDVKARTDPAALFMSGTATAINSLFCWLLWPLGWWCAIPLAAWCGSASALALCLRSRYLE